MGDRAIDCEDYVQNFTILINPTQGEDCSICYGPAKEDDKRIITPHCRHDGILYHEKCLLRWLRPDLDDPAHDNNRCPVCRRSLWEQFTPLSDFISRNSEEVDDSVIPFGLVHPDDPMRDLPQLDDSDLWDATVGATLVKIFEHAESSLDELFGRRYLDHDAVLQFTGIDLTDNNERTPLSKANRMLHYHAILETTTRLPEFVHLIRRGLITASLMEFHLGTIDPEDWSALMADLRACRTEVNGLGGNTVSFLADLPLSGVQVWQRVVSPLLSYAMDIPVTKGASILTTYHMNDNQSSVVKSITYTLREGLNFVAGYSSRIHIEILFGTSESPLSNILMGTPGASLSVAVGSVDVVSGLSVSQENHQINIRLANGYQIGIRY